MTSRLKRIQASTLDPTVLLPLCLNMGMTVASLKSLGNSFSSQMLLRKEWQASRATGAADLRTSADIPSIPGAFPELLCLIAFKISSIVRGRSRLWTVGFCGIRSRAWGSTAEGLLSRLLKCSLHHASILLFSLSMVEPSANRNYVVQGLAGPWTSLMELKNILDSCVSAYLCTSSDFLTHHLSCILRSAAWACLFRCLKRLRLGMEEGSFCHSMKAFSWYAEGNSLTQVKS